MVCVERTNTNIRSAVDKICYACGFMPTICHTKSKERRMQSRAEALRCRWSMKICLKWSMTTSQSEYDACSNLALDHEKSSVGARESGKSPVERMRLTAQQSCARTCKTYEESAKPA